MSAISLVSTLKEIVAQAREHAPFYRELYADVPEEFSLQDLPVVDTERFWLAHQSDRNSVLTGPLNNGMVFNSGGTTGSPKFSYVTNDEYEAIVGLLARCYEAVGVRAGERVANLFASGSLYASFTFATDGLKRLRPGVVQFPLGYSADLAPAASVIQKFDINVLAGFPTHMLRLIEYMEQEGMSGVRIDRMIYGGEMLSQDQQTFLRTRFPGIEICSAGYASVDAGFIGYADTACAPGEHRVFDGSTLVEIVDEETEQPIEETNVPGRVVFTNLIRRLMPLVRYPTGDRAQWIEEQGSADRKFRLLGRSQEGARVASYTVGVAEVATWLEPLKASVNVQQFQLLVTREDRYDRLTFRVVGEGSREQLDRAAETLLETFARLRPEIQEDQRTGILHPPRIEWIRPGDLIVSERTGKLLRVVDRRVK